MSEQCEWKIEEARQRIRYLLDYRIDPINGALGKATAAARQLDRIKANTFRRGELPGVENVCASSSVRETEEPRVLYSRRQSQHPAIRLCGHDGFPTSL